MENQETIIEQERELLISFSFDDLKIIGAYPLNDKKKKEGNIVYVQGVMFDNSKDDPSDQTVILIMHENLLQGALTNWIACKSRICSHYDHFCGEMGYVKAKEFEFANETINLLVDGKIDENDNWIEERIDAPLIYVYDIEEDVDMEHG